tara:strand:- start:105 stop:272 length:168 start_codon:yes stop_codon:yes gene_type:complete
MASRQYVYVRPEESKSLHSVAFKYILLMNKLGFHFSFKWVKQRKMKDLFAGRYPS